MQTKSAMQEANHAPFDKAQEAFAKGREAAQDAISMGREAAQEVVSKGREALMQRVGAATDWAGSLTKNNPLRTLAITAAVGAIVALLIARR